MIAGAARVLRLGRTTRQSRMDTLFVQPRLSGMELADRFFAALNVYEDQSRPTPPMTVRRARARPRAR